jgi:shikimate 5-dehydrogenase
MTHPDRFLLAGVMGDPVMHSRSPKLHNYWLAKYGLTGTYVPLAIRAEHLRAALRALPALGSPVAISRFRTRRPRSGSSTSSIRSHGGSAR